MRPRPATTLDNRARTKQEKPELVFDFLGCFLMLRKALLDSYCFVVWILFVVFCFFCFTSLGDRNTKNCFFVLDTGDLRTLVINKKKAIVSDECLTQAEECYKFGSNTGQNHNRATKSTQKSNNVVDKLASQAATGSAASEGSNKTVEVLGGGGTKASAIEDSAAWSQNQQKQLELALQKFPKTVADRWTCIANAVPGKTKVKILV